MNQKSLLITALLIVLAGASYFLFSHPKVEAPVTEPSPVVEGSVVTGDEPIDTSDWQTYRNEEYGFELKYPKGWPEPLPFQRVGDNQRTFIYQGGGFEGCCQGVRLEVTQKPAAIVYQQRLENLPAGDLISNHQRNLLGVSAQEIVYDTHYGKNERVTFVSVGSDETLELGVADDDRLADQIVSTFSSLVSR